MKNHGQPYTRISLETRYEEIETEVDGKMVKGLRPEQGFAVYGYTFEDKLQPDTGDDPEWKKEWEQHDLGLEPTLEAAYQKALDWRESLSGIYAII